MASRLRLELVPDALSDRRAAAAASGAPAAPLAVVWIDSPSRPVNTLGRKTLADFEALLPEIERQAGDLLGVVLASAKPSGFLAGADLDELAQLDSPERLEGLARRGQQLLDRWEALAVPTVAAIRGPALGGGLEVALACTWRVAAAEPATSLGLPEVQLGLVPALGGTYRLPRRVGLARGIEMLLAGRRLDAREALAAGLVDEVVPAPALLAAARRLAGRGARREEGRWRDALVAGNPLGRAVLLRAARARAAARTGGHYPAPPRILDAVAAGCAAGRRAGLAAEGQAFGELALTPISRRLVALFLATRQLGTGVETGGWKEDLAVVGAGFMGSGIAAAAARAGHRVRLLDAVPAALGRGYAFCAGRFASLARRRRIVPEQARADLARIAPGLLAEGLPLGVGRAGIVLEAVVEDPDVKLSLLRRLEAEAAPGAILASNTSTIPIGRLAAVLARPERMIGLHFFSPVHRMPLVEIIRHAGSGEEAVRRGLALVVSLGKTPIVVADGPGFYTSRILSPYLAQGARLLLEGMAIPEVDAAGRRAGFPVGPLELLDEVGLDVAAHAARTMAEAFPERMPAAAEFGRLVAAARVGRKSGRGFYDYTGKRKRPDPAALDLLGLRPAGGAAAEPEEAAGRLLWAMTAEAIRCLEDGVLPRPLEGDVGAVLGLGFPPFRGGPFRFTDAVGAEDAVRLLEELAREHGPVFQPPALLRRMAAAGERFYPPGGSAQAGP